MSPDSPRSARLYGYTIADAVKCALYLPREDWPLAFGRTTERAMFFIGITRGVGVMSAMRAYPLKPRLAVLVGVKKTDPVVAEMPSATGSS